MEFISLDRTAAAIGGWNLSASPVMIVLIALTTSGYALTACISLMSEKRCEFHQSSKVRYLHKGSQWVNSSPSTEVRTPSLKALSDTKSNVLLIDSMFPLLLCKVSYLL